VTLKGEVEYAFQKQEAERAIRHIAGIKGITNLIVVRPRVSPSDLKEKIERKLVRNAETDAEHIQVDVEGSKVILRGAVRCLLYRNPSGKALVIHARDAPAVP
jgi:osmotically-inducible protein OsmY